MAQRTAESAEAIHRVASSATYGGAAGATVFGFTVSEWSVIGVIGGLVIALLGFFVNIYFKRQHLLIAMRNAKADEDE